MNKTELEKKANQVRKGIINAVYGAQSGHPGGSLSIADIITYLYFCEMKIDPQNAKDPDRDRFVLSKGHTAPALYSVLANRGYFSVDELPKLRHYGAMLRVIHVCRRHRELICLQDHWDRESQQQQAWHSRQRWIIKTTEYIQS